MQHSVTRWIVGLRNGDSEAVLQLFERYWEALVLVAKRHMRNNPHPLGDEEDLAQSVLASLYRGAVAGRLNDLANRDELWGLLLAITQRKSIDNARHARRLKRGGGKVVNEADFVDFDASDVGFNLNELAGSSPTPEFLAAMEEQTSQLMALLRDDSLRQIALLRLEGYTVLEIATKMNLYTRAIERKLQLIRELWATQIGR